MIIKLVLLSLTVILSVYFDYKYSKIKNFIVYPAILLGLLTNLIMSGTDGFKDSLLGIIVPFIILFLFYALRFLGAGDVKLFSAIGAVMGLRFIIYCMAYSFLFGGFLALIIMIKRKNFSKRFKKLFLYLKYLFTVMKFEEYQEFDEDKSGVFRFSYAVLGGVIITIIHKSTIGIYIM
ncbi:prepilin peptidase [Herbivorax sp. ANBcel31]|uniref:A24 family peptidase n=1 Tax=Herbivorax sp. ANBcel31 TaxID=3069754 RepID=UPI0027B39EEE|nr:prepilin peptidase [Herbivorax sp. ANBcel31]MDQ2085702.1 prepilin peptidase [Herbivorax sp. ANBcel31]